ncbi:MAG: hypothetical protein ACJAR3_002871, partial [Roseivirga sp.]
NIDKAIQQLPSQNALPPAEDGGLNLTVPADSVQ